MPRNRTVAALEDVESCSFCQGALSPEQAVMWTESWPPANNSKRYTSARWFACSNCWQRVSYSITGMQTIIRRELDREFHDRQNASLRETNVS